MDDLLEEFESWMRGWGAAETTIHARVKMARRTIALWGLDGFTSITIQRFLAADDKGERRKPWTRSTYYAHLAGFSEWMVASRRWPANPMDEIKKPMRGSNRPRPLSEAEVAVVLDAARGDTYAWIVLALTAGLRASEIAKLRGEDVTPDGIYVIGKGDKHEVLPCSPEVLALRQRYPLRGWWFPGNEGGHVKTHAVTAGVGKLFRAQGIAEGSIHRCRHVYGTRLLRAGVNIRTVQKMMRHSSLATTANYTAVDEDELRAAVMMLPPLPKRPEPPTAA